jgi:hypothetical protein
VDGKVIPKRVMALRTETVGYVLPKPQDRHPGHEPVNWFQTDYDDQFDDPDAPDPPDPLPTERHRTVPGFPSGG